MLVMQTLTVIQYKMPTKCDNIPQQMQDVS